MPREVYEYVEIGGDKIVEMYDRIGDARRRSEQGGARAGGGGRGRGEETALQAAAKRAEREAERASKAAERAAAAQGRAAERGAKATAAAAQRAGKEQERAAAQAAKAVERAEALKTRAAERAAREQAKAREHVFQIRARYDAAEARAERTAASRARQQQYMRGERARSAVIGGIAAGVTSRIIGGGARLVGAGMDLAEAGAREQLDIGKIARRVSINSRAPGAEGVDPKAIAKEMQDISASVSRMVGATDVGMGIQAFVTKTGNVEKAREFAPDIAEISVAADASLESVSKTAADLFQKFGIDTKEGMQQALGSLYFGGKSGAFELADFAEKMAPIASAGQRFGVDKGVRGVQVMSGLSQVAMEATGDRDRASTAVSAMMRQMVAKSGELRSKHGVDVFRRDGSGTNDITQTLPDMIANVGGANIAKKTVGLQALMGDEGIVGISPLIAAFSEASNAVRGAGGKPATEAERIAAGREAVSAKLNSAIDATGAWTEVQKDSKNAQSDTSAKLNNSWEMLKSSIGEKLIPKIEELSGQLPEFIDSISEVTGYMGDLAIGISDLLSMLGWDKAAAGRKAERRGSEATREAGKLEELAKSRPLTGAESKQLASLKETAASSGKEAEFIQKYTEMDTGWRSTSQKKENAKQYWDKLQADPSGAANYAQMMSAFRIPGVVSGQNDAQLALINQEANSRQSELQSTRGVSEVSGAAEAKGGIAEFVRSLADATRAAQGFSAKAAPSVFTGG